jgi:hypothetical protein
MQETVSLEKIPRTLEQRNGYVEYLIADTDRIIKQAFTPADAARNPRVIRNVRLLSAIQGVSREKTYTTFGLPPPPKLSKVEADGILEIRLREVAHQFNYALARMAEEEKKKERTERKPVPPREEKPLTLSISDEEIARDPRTREIISLLKAHAAEYSKGNGIYVRRGFYSDHLFDLLLELKELVPLSTREIAIRILDCPPDTLKNYLYKYQVAGHPRDQNNQSTLNSLIERDTLITMIKSGAGFDKLSADLHIPPKTLGQLLIHFDLKKEERLRIQREANPRVQEIIDRLKTIGSTKPRLADRVLPGFFDEEVLSLVKELRHIYDISVTEVAKKMLNCNESSLTTYLRSKKKEPEKALPPTSN